jgi:hypothetical protein
MKIFKKYLNDIKTIEKVLLTCYAHSGKTSLIQSKLDLTTIDQTFILTNDGYTILTSMNFFDNQLLILIKKLVQNHSQLFGDGCKTLFFYISTFLDKLLEPELFLNNIQDLEKFTDILRLSYLSEFIDIFNSEWQKHIKTLNDIIILESVEDFLINVDKICVLNDLFNLNKNLSQITKDFTIQLIKNYMISVELNNINTIGDKFRTILNDLDHLLIFSSSSSLSSTKIYENGFLLESGRLSLNTIINIKNLADIKAIFLYQELDNESHLDFKINLNSINDIDNLFYAEQASNFSNEFVENLNQTNIKLIFTNRALTDIQKSKLIVNNISYIEYVDLDKLNKISINQLNIKSVNVNDSSIKENNIFYIDEMVNVESNKIIYFKLNKLKHPRTSIFIYFCSPTKILFNHFKNNLIKTLKSFISLETTHVLIKSGIFEKEAIQVCHNLEKKYLNLINDDRKMYEYYIFFKVLKSIFHNLYEKLNKYNNLNDQLSMSLLISDVQKEAISFDVFYLKSQFIIQSLYFMQKISKVDKIIFYKKKDVISTKSNRPNLDEDDDLVM